MTRWIVMMIAMADWIAKLKQKSTNLPLEKSRSKTYKRW